MKIAIVDSTRTFGGAFELAVTLVREWSATPGIGAVLISGQPLDVLTRRIPATIRWRHFSLPLRRSFDSRSSLLRRAGFAGSLFNRDVLGGLRLASILRAERADLVFLNNSLHGQVYGVLAAKLCGIPCVCSYRDHEYKSLLTCLAHHGVTQHVVSTPLLASHLHKLGVNPARISRIWDGVNEMEFSPEIPVAPLEQMFGVTANRQVVGIFGRLVHYKGQEDFLTAMRKVVDIIPSAHGLVVGDVSDGHTEFEAVLRRKTQSLGLDDHITFTGYRREVGSLMRACEVVVHASREPEPFGTVVLEAMACGRPCVAMNEGGPPEMIEDGRSGLLVPPNDPTSMARAIVQILSDPGFSQNLRDAGRRRVLEHFTAARFAANHLTLFSSLGQRGNK